MDSVMLRDGAGRPSADRKDGTARLRRGRVSAAAVLDTAAQGYLVFDSRMRVALCNPQAARMLGVPQQPGRHALTRLLQDSATLGASAQLALSQAAHAARHGDCPAEGQRIGSLHATIRPLPAGDADADTPPGLQHCAFWLISLDAVQPGLGALPLDSLTGVADRAGFLKALSAMLADPPGGGRGDGLHGGPERFPRHQ